MLTDFFTWLKGAIAVVYEDHRLVGLAVLWLLGVLTVAGVLYAAWVFGVDVAGWFS